MTNLLPTISAGSIGVITFRPLPDVEPFSIRSAASYEDILSTIRVWIRDELVPYLNTESVQATFQDNVNTLIDTVNGALTAQALTVTTALNTAVQELADGAVPISDPTILAVLNTSASATLAWLQAHYGNDYRPEAFVQAGDAGDWALAIGRALAAATAAGRPLILSQMYACATTVTLPSGASIVGLGKRTGVRAPTNVSMVLLAGTNVSDVTLSNFTVDGNCLTQTVKAIARSIRFIASNRLRLHGITTTFNPDWAASFEQSSNITVTEYTHGAGRANLTGGRDGIHFLDCTDVLLDGAKIHSGDDCVGITSQTQAISNITIRNVTGVSEIAAVVTLGNESTTTYSGSGIVIENINTFNSLDFPGSFSTYVVKLRAQNSAQDTDIRVSNISGKSVSHGVWFDGNAVTTDSMSQVTLSNVRVKSLTGHGVYLNRTTNFLLSNVFGSSTDTHDGVSLFNSGPGTIHGGGAKYAGMWGLQLNACANVDVWGSNCRDNGGAAFASNNGGNLRIVNSTACKIYGGQYVGGATTSYYGVSQSGNTGIDLTAVPPTFGGAN